MTESFVEGQEVEVLTRLWHDKRGWHKATIDHRTSRNPSDSPEKWEVQFPDGRRAVFDAEHIRAATKTLKERIVLKLTEVGRDYCDWSYRK